MSEGAETRYRMPTAEQRASAKRLVALYDYESQTEGVDIALKKGEVVYGVELQGEWWWGYNSKCSGMFPVNFVQEQSMEANDDQTGNGASKPGLVHEQKSDEYDGDCSTDEEAELFNRPRRTIPAASKSSEIGTEENEEGPDPFSGEVDDEELPAVSKKAEAQEKRDTIQNIPGLNLQWAIDNNLKHAHSVYLWNGNFSKYVPCKLLLTNDFLIEAAYFTPDLPEVTVYPLFKLYINPTQKINRGFMKRGYITLRSQYYFCNLSTTAYGGGHNELLTDVRERFYTFTSNSQMDGHKKNAFLQRLMAAIVKAKSDCNTRFVEHIRSLKGYENLYDQNPPHFDQKIKELVFATDIVEMVEDAFVAYEDLKFMLE